MKKLILTPISKSNLEAKKDYDFEKGQSPFSPIMWTGEVNGKDQVGDYFGFLHYDKDEIELYIVDQVFNNSVGRRHWKSYSNKKTVVMKPFSTTISFSQWKKDAGYKDNLVVNATKRLKFPY